MKNFVSLLSVFLLSLIFGTSSCHPQAENIKNQFSDSNDKRIGGACDTCEYMYLDMPENIVPVSYSPGWSENGKKLLLTGTVYKIDGKSPAPNVIIYYWQTDNNGLYSPKKGMPSETRRHGHIRGWAKTDENGRYSIYTIRPAPYPNGDEPAHIHLVIKEPNLANEYFIDDLVFDEDELLLPMMKNRPPQNRGGSGVARIYHRNDLQIAERNIILGLNIPDYPEKIETKELSGLQIGLDNPSFAPFHAWGNDRGSRACPVCKYGKFLGVLYFVGNNPNWNEIKKWLTFLEKESVKRNGYLKAYFIYGNERDYDKVEREKELAAIGRELKLTEVAITFVPSLTDSESDVNLNKVNPSFENTFIIFRRNNIVAKFVELKSSDENFTVVSNTLDKFTSQYFGTEK